MPYTKTIWPSPLPYLDNIENGIFDTLAHSGKVHNVAEFLRRYPSSDTGGVQEALNEAENDGGGMIFQPAGTIDYDTTIHVPQNILWTGAGPAAVLHYTGSGIAIAINEDAPKDCTQWRAIIEKFRLDSTTGAVGILARNVYETLIQEIAIDGHNGGWSTAGIQLDATIANNGAEFCNRIHQNWIRQCNGAAVKFTGRDAHNQDVISENRIQGSKSYGIHAEARISGLLVMGNDCEGNVGAEMRFEGGVAGLNIQSNFMETVFDAQNGIELSGSDFIRGVAMICNKFVYAGEDPEPPSAGTALVMDGTHADGYNGIIFRANEIQFYGTGIDFGGKEYYGCDFESNSYVACEARYANLPAVASEVMILRRLSGSKTWDPTPYSGIGTTEVDVDGAEVGDFVKAAFTTQGSNDILISAHVNRADKVLVILLNKTGGEINLPEGTLYVEVQKIARA